jgi:hypothetical protein
MNTNSPFGPEKIRRNTSVSQGLANVAAFRTQHGEARRPETGAKVPVMPAKTGRPAH